MEKEKTDQKKKQEQITANEYTDVRDIQRKVLYTKSGYSISYIRLFPLNIDLLTKSEKISICNTLTAEFKPETEPFILYSIPRAVEMETYMNYLSEAYDKEMSNGKRKMLINAMINNATETVMNGDNFEHQFYIKIWEKSNDKYSNNKLDDRSHEFINRYATIQNTAKRIDDTDILKLNNLFGNCNTAAFESYDSSLVNTPFPTISELTEDKE